MPLDTLAIQLCLPSSLSLTTPHLLGIHTKIMSFLFSHCRNTQPVTSQVLDLLSFNKLPPATHPHPHSQSPHIDRIHNSQKPQCQASHFPNITNYFFFRFTHCNSLNPTPPIPDSRLFPMTSSPLCFFILSHLRSSWGPSSHHAPQLPSVSCSSLANRHSGWASLCLLFIHPEQLPVAATEPPTRLTSFILSRHLKLHRDVSISWHTCCVFLKLLFSAMAFRAPCLRLPHSFPLNPS